MLSNLVRPGPKTLPQDAACALSDFLQSECGLYYDEADRLVFEANKALPQALANQAQGGNAYVGEGWGWAGGGGGGG